MKEKQAGSLKFAEVLESLDREIQALRAARALLLGEEVDVPVKRGWGRARTVQPGSPEGSVSSRKRSPKGE